LAAASQRLGEKIYADVQDADGGTNSNDSTGARDAANEKKGEEVTDVEFKDANAKR
ncbi:MAG: hypothetical protein IN818_03370, partial [Cutibacterium sp.]|nr:hypothetical protein [Cutibacterium sp.]